MNKRDEYGRTPLMNCALVDDERWGVGLARTLLEQGARSAPRDRLGFTALHYACVHRRPFLVGVLLAAADFDVRAADRRGNSSLHYAAATGDCIVTGALLAAYRRYRLPINAVNRANQTALEFAYHHNGHIDCVQMIRDAQEAATSVAVDATSSPKSQSPSQIDGDGDGLGTKHADGGVDVDCTVTTMTTSSQQRRADRRPHGDQLRTSIMARTSLAGRTTCRMFHTSTSHVAAGATRTSQADGSTATSVNCNVDELILKASVNLRPLRLAPIRDPHSRPLLMILHQSAAEFFSSVPNGQTSCGRRSSDACSWRVKMSRLYDEYGYQFSSLYKPAACTGASTENAVMADSWSTPGASRTRNSSISDATQMQRQRGGHKMSTVRCSAAGVGGSTTVGGGASSPRKKSMQASPSVNSVRSSIRRTLSQSSALSLVTAHGDTASVHRPTP